MNTAGLRTSPATRQGLSVGLATGAYGVSFGALGVAAGLDVWQTCALSLLMFTGGSQFAFVGIIGTGGGGLAATATAGLLGFRNSLYSLQIVPMLGLAGGHGRKPGRRLVAAQLTIDESTAVGLAQTDPDERRRGFWVTGFSVFLLWNLTTAIGAVLGNVLGDPRQYGLDGAASAAFLALLWPRLTTGPSGRGGRRGLRPNNTTNTSGRGGRRGPRPDRTTRLARLSAVGAAAVCAAAVTLTPPGIPVLAAAAFAAGAAVVMPARAPQPDTGSDRREAR